MAEKIAPGVIWEQAATEGEQQEKQDRLLAKLRKRRDDARWYVVAGIGLLFAGSFSVYFAMGGVLMAVYGSVVYVATELRMKSIDDPWDDPEIDAWEQENFD